MICGCGMLCKAMEMGKRQQKVEKQMKEKRKEYARENGLNLYEAKF